jgi:K+ transporter
MFSLTDSPQVNLGPVVRIAIGITLVVLALVSCYPFYIFPDSSEALFLASLLGIPCLVVGVAVMIGDGRQARITTGGYILCAVLLVVIAVISTWSGDIFAVFFWFAALACLLLAYFRKKQKNTFS